MGLAVPFGLLGLVLLAPVIAMYLLKRRREEVEVSSTFLWERLVQDMEANAPWQKLRRNLLLLLQLLFLLLAVLGLARPFVRTAGAAGQSLILVVDGSLSMGARDAAEGTRWDAARQEALRLVEGLPDEGRVTIIRAGDGAEILAANSTDRVAVREALVAVTPTAKDSDLGPALTLAAAAASRQSDSEIVVLSDGAVQLPETLLVDRPVRYVPIGSQNNNQAISALNLTPREGGYDLFAQVTNYGDEDITRRLVVERDGQPFTAVDLSIPAGQQTSRILPMDVLEAGEAFVIEAHLESTDVLPADDAAWAVPPPAGSRRVHLLTPSQANRFLSVPFRILPGVAFSQGSVLSDTGTLEGAEKADLLILDRWLPEEGLPGTTENLLIVAPPAGNDVIQSSGVITNVLPLKTGQVPLLEENLFFESDLFFVEARAGEVPAWGTVVLEDAGSGAPLLWVGEQEGRRIAVLNLALYGVPESVPLDEPRDVVLTNFVFHPAYPVLMASLADYLLSGPVGGLAGESLLPGDAVTLPLLDATGIRVEMPDGRGINLDASTGAAGRGAVSFVPQVPGIYTASWEGSEQEPIRFTVNYFVPSESRVAPQPTLPLSSSPGDGAGESSNLTGEARQEFWRPLLLIALLVLAVEWMVYQRDAVLRLRGWVQRRVAA